MPSLAETQAQFRRAVVASAAAPPAVLCAPADVAGRLAIYRRNYREGLTRHLRGRFPTVEWLLGSSRVGDLAEVFLRSSPPAAPCLAEYGRDFVTFVASNQGTRTLPYLEDVALLDWHLGDVSVAVDAPALAITVLSRRHPDSLPDLRLTLQPGLRYLRSSWPVDDLVRIRLSEQAPEQLVFSPAPVALELRGARGQFRIDRLAPAVFRFRESVGRGETLGAAIQRGIEADPDFDVSSALAALFAEGLVAATPPNEQE